MYNCALPSKPTKSSFTDKYLVKMMRFSTSDITLSWQLQETNRILSDSNPDNFMLVSFANLRFEGQLKQTAEYIEHVLKSGVYLNGVKYLFCGNSNSQLKSRTCYLYAAKDSREVLNMINGLGDFKNISSVGKRAKRIGLLFSSAKISTNLDPSFTEDIADIESNGNIFTDGCGFISKGFANTIARSGKIVFRNIRYVPSVFQIRYKGYKGVLVLNLELDKCAKPIKAQFRNSMRKFTNCPVDTFFVVGYSQPYEFGKLNGEFTTLLSCLGISDEVFIRKQEEYFQFLNAALHDPNSAFQFVCSKNRIDLAEDLVLHDGHNVEDSEKLWKEIRNLVQDEWKKSYGKRDAERVHIMIPESRLLYGVCDPTGKLDKNEVFVRFTCERRGSVSLDGAHVVVGRNPCLHPGDIRKFRAVELEELNHLVDCIVFSTRGDTPQPSMMSGGDLDGDKFFVCWDKDLIPSIEYDAYCYPPAKETLQRHITYETMVNYFAHYANTSLGRVKNLYLEWLKCSEEGAGSQECQELNALFSSCVDGEKIKIPKHLESPPEPKIQESILNKLCENVLKKAPEIINESTISTAVTSIDLMEHIILTDDACMSELELFQLAHRCIRKAGLVVDDFLPYFNFSSFTSEQKHCILSQLTCPDQWVGPMFNSLYSSKLITEQDLRKYNLGLPKLHWKQYYSSLSDNCLRLSPCLSKAMMQFHRKLIILRINDQFAIAVYISKPLSAREDIDISDACKIFTFVSSAHDMSFTKDITEADYKLTFDGNIFQLYQKVKTATLLFFLVQHPERDKGLKGDTAFPELSVSIALQKLSKHIKDKVGKVQREKAVGMEIYVISNRDRIGQQILDITMNQVDTTEIIPRIQNIAKEYKMPDANSITWENHPVVFRRILMDDSLHELPTIGQTNLLPLFSLCLMFNANGKLMNIVEYVLKNPEKFPYYSYALEQIMAIIPVAPFIAVTVVQALPSTQVRECSALLICKGLVRCTNELKDIALKQLQHFLKVMSTEKQMLAKSEVTELVKAIVFGIRDAELAREFLFALLQDNKCIAEDDRADNKANEYFVKCILAQAMNYVNEVSEKCPCDMWGNPEETVKPVLQCLQIQLVVAEKNIENSESKEEEQLYETIIRVDVHQNVRNKDHIRLRASSTPTNKPLHRLTVLDAIVQSAKKGCMQFYLQQCAPVELESASWDLFQCAGTTTFDSMLDAVNHLVSKKTEATCAFNVIIGTNNIAKPLEWKPIHETEVKKNLRKNVNESQLQSIIKAVNNPTTLIWGPPGTGKTTVVVQIILQHLKHYPEFKILVTASTHNAVDNVLERLIKELKESNERLEDDQLIRVTSEVSKVNKSMQRWTLDAFVESNLSGTENMKAKREALKKIKKAKVVFSTCSGAGVGILRNEKLKYQIAIVDEASQITEPNCLIPIVRCSQKVILVGDHLQLRPTITQLGLIFDCDVSLFEKLYNSDHPGITKEMLNKQYRMHPILAKFPSEHFYNDRLLSEVAESSRFLPASNFPWPEESVTNQSTDSNPPFRYPLVFVNCLTPESPGASKCNRGQAECVAQIVRMLNQKQKADGNRSELNTNLKIIVLTPYSAQVREIKSKTSALAIDVVTIDGFQGREGDIVIFSTVRSNNHGQLGFLEDERRMNVALTRAKYGLIIVGNAETLSSNELWNKLLKVCRLVKIL